MHNAYMQQNQPRESLDHGLIISGWVLLLASRTEILTNGDNWRHANLIVGGGNLEFLTAGLL